MIEHKESEDENLLEQCKFLTQWGHKHTYHWFWGISYIKPHRNIKYQSIYELITTYHRNGLIDVVKRDVLEYRAKNIVSRFFIRLFNYKDLYNKHILITYYDISQQIAAVQGESMKFGSGLFKWQPAFVSNIIQSNLVLGKYTSILGSSAKASWSHIANYFFKQKLLPIESKPQQVENNSVDNSYQDIHCIYSYKQVSALQALNINCQLGEKYSDSQVEESFRKLAKIYHPDKGGSDEKFKYIYEARETLEKLKDAIVDLREKFSSECSEFEKQAYNTLRKIVDNYKLKINHSTSNSSYDFIDQQVKCIDIERKRVISEYKINRRHAFTKFMLERNSHFSGTDSAFIAIKAFEETNEGCTVAFLEHYLDVEIKTSCILAKLDVRLAQERMLENRNQHENDEYKSDSLVHTKNDQGQSPTICESSSAYSSKLSIFGTRRESTPHKIFAEDRSDITPIF